jgi:hypothetical protein
MSGTLYFGPGPGASWPLTIAAVEAALQQRFPSARFVHRTMPTNQQPYLRFELDPGDGELRKGTFGSNGVLSLSDGTPEVWAGTIAWYLSLLPPATSVYAFVEESSTDPSPVPETVTAPEAIVEFLRSIEA